MLLYRLVSDDDNAALLPPRSSKYPSGISLAHSRGLVAYAYDPAVDDLEGDLEDEKPARSCCGWRGVMNIGLLVILVLALLCLFVGYPILTYFRDHYKNIAVADNTPS